jgi:hypothetical protein
VQVNLLMLQLPDPKFGCELHKLARTTTFGKVTDIFHDRIPSWGQSPVRKEGGFAGQIMGVIDCRPVRCPCWSV